MKAEISGGPAFAHVHVDLEAGESITAESGAMQSMSADLDLKAHLNGGFLSALGKKWFGGESLMASTFSNNTAGTRRVTLAQDVPGEIRRVDLKEGETLCMQRGAWLASAGKVKVKTVWAGFISMFAGEGLMKLLAVGGTNGGSFWYGAYGGIIEREVDGELFIDNGFLVAYQKDMKLKIALPGGLFASMFGGEGFVTRVVGNGKIWIQTRSLKGLAAWLNPKFR
ncbi:MAG: TIGR00266 family protein [Spirochaetaceae bacterium]|nr:TIGR00266 family protein [Spirochaetaceae bacterium]RKX87737.1 MAG: TIGR00266 family protein [Spirochaetota bacterium]RKX97963.1 MAG: TIGR00266 family protein [Spirochaetota bacterium]